MTGEKDDSRESGKAGEIKMPDGGGDAPAGGPGSRGRPLKFWDQSRREVDWHATAKLAMRFYSRVIRIGGQTLYYVTDMTDPGQAYLSIRAGGTPIRSLDYSLRDF
ncbi:MAG: hypothetical protein LBT40_08030 [Deltaproteobacteria bacterium]|nr:hypothetical protein [Deltaproteobacteria bacterium]